ncbi:MAG: ABC transporter ATP-binding protein [Minwuia sp.]|nr:ABC transporter ATP-binding protein [Minwuia sp.]
MTALSFQNVIHQFGDFRAVDDLSLDVAPGEIVCLLGPSGCGKTTSLRLAAGLETLQAGQISINGTSVAVPGHSVPPEARRIGMVFQDYALFPHLSVAGNVGFGLKGDIRQSRVREVLARVGLESSADVFPHQLSGGEQQRVALARALAPAPGLMLMDEPFANLDVTLRNAVRDETLALLKRLGATVMLVTHDPEEAMRMADRIAVMQAGRLVQFGPATDVYLKPANRFMAKFFGPVNELSAMAEGDRVTSALGTLPQPADLPSGPLDMLIRPEGVRLGGEPAGGLSLQMTVTDSRLIGPYWRVQLTSAGMPSLRARTTSRPPAIGEEIGVSIDPERVILFPSGMDGL